VTGLRRWAGIYRALFVAEFQAAAQYRLQSFLWLLFAVVRPVVFLAAWTAVADAQGGSVGGFSTADFATYYVSLTLVTQLVTAWNAYDFELEVREGRLSPKLLRPLHPLHYSIVGNIVWKVVTLPGLVPALVVIAWTFHARLAAEPWQVVLFVPSVLLAATLSFVYSWLNASLAFWTTRIQAILSLQDRVGFIFAGQIAPLALLPAGPMQVIAYILPYGYMISAPASILTGHPSPVQALLLVAGQMVWLVVCWLGYRLLWTFGLRQFSAVGA
jgi:ABC-2 type transport system permease protein